MRIIVAAVLTALAFLQRPAPSRPPDREAAYRANNMGVARLEQFAYDEATRSFREALRLSPNLDSARLNLGIAHFYGSRPAEAATEARAAAARNSRGARNSRSMAAGCR